MGDMGSIDDFKDNSTFTDALGMFSVAYWWYGLVRQPSVQIEYYACNDGMDIGQYYTLGFDYFCNYISGNFKNTTACGGLWDTVCKGHMYDDDGSRRARR